MADRQPITIARNELQSCDRTKNAIFVCIAGWTFEKKLYTVLGTAKIHARDG